MNNNCGNSFMKKKIINGSNHLIKQLNRQNNKAVYAFAALNEETYSRASWVPIAREKLRQKT